MSVETDLYLWLTVRSPQLEARLLEFDLLVSLDLLHLTVLPYLDSSESRCEYGLSGRQ